MTREEMVTWLTNDDIEYIARQLAEGNPEYLYDILIGNGYTQLCYMSTEQLAKEIKTRKANML